MISPAELVRLDEELMAMFNGRCAVHLSHPAVAVHEIMPRSKRPNDWWDPSNRIPLCDKAHRQTHEMGTREATMFLKKRRKFALKILGHERHSIGR